MDTSREWMYPHMVNGILVPGFRKKVEEFVEFAKNYSTFLDGTKIKCPCNQKWCRNQRYLEPDEVVFHVVSKGFLPNYYCWNFHGEKSLTSGYRAQPEFHGSCAYDVDPIENEHAYHAGPIAHDTSAYDNLHTMVMDAAGPTFEYPTNDPEPPNADAQRFYDMMIENETLLYDGCKHSVLSAITRTMSIKSEYKFSEACYDKIIELIREMLPEDNLMPKSFYETRKLVSALGLPVKKIDVCVDGCMLYWGEDKDRTECKMCNKPRGGKNSVMWYFPLTPRLQRLYASEFTSRHMRWHAEHKFDPDIMIHPSDAEAWKHFDRSYPEFAKETRNIRLGLYCDGFMPFGQYGKQHSCWPVILTPYNLPPGMCMKEEVMFLTVLVPGPKNPKQLLDVFLQPLIDELKQLWTSGALTFDCSQKQNFMLHAALMWTISDFPAYSMLSGWSTQGRLACPICMENTDAFTLPKGGKQSWFDNHRKFLPQNHPYRSNKKDFIKNTVVAKMAPLPRSGIEILQWMNELGVMKSTDAGFEKHNDKIQRNKDSGWKKRSIFWDLPYWSTNLIRHNLDVMHIEKNCFENVFNTVMDIKGKTKDNEKSREDLRNICKRPSLNRDKNGVFPPANYVLKKNAKSILCDWMKSLKFPDGYVSNMSRCVEKKKYQASGMKSHDCHVFMQRLLPIAFRYLLPEKVWESLTEFSLYFKELSCATIRVSDMERLEKDIPIILCNLERIFPPSFFDSMEHVVVHLAYEAKIAGPVQYRWMYTGERYLKHMKSNPGNRAHIGASMANCYITEEASNFGSLYFEPRVSTKRRKVCRNDDGGEREAVSGNLSIFTHPGRSSGKCTQRRIEGKEYHTARTYILLNCPEIQPYLSIYMRYLQEELQVQTDVEVSRDIDEHFAKWFEKYAKGNSEIQQNQFLSALAEGPLPVVKTYPVYFVNGYKFHTIKRGSTKVTANSGVSIKGSNDYSDQSSPTDYYGVLTEIMEVEYPRLPIKRTVLFNCNWFNPSSQWTRFHKRFNIVDVNVGGRYPRYDPFILAMQAMQVCYIPYPSENESNKCWRAVCKVKARSVVQLPNIQSELTSAFQDDETTGQTISETHDTEFDNLNDPYPDSDWEIDLEEQEDPPQVYFDSSESNEENELNDEEDDYENQD